MFLENMLHLLLENTCSISWEFSYSPLWVRNKLCWGAQWLHLWDYIRLNKGGKNLNCHPLWTFSSKDNLEGIFCWPQRLMKGLWRRTILSLFFSFCPFLQKEFEKPLIIYQITPEGSVDRPNSPVKATGTWG